MVALWLVMSWSQTESMGSSWSLDQWWIELIIGGNVFIREKAVTMRTARSAGEHDAEFSWLNLKCCYTVRMMKSGPLGIKKAKQCRPMKIHHNFHCVIQKGCSTMYLPAMVVLSIIWLGKELHMNVLQKLAHLRSTKSYTYIVSKTCYTTSSGTKLP